MPFSKKLQPTTHHLQPKLAFTLIEMMVVLAIMIVLVAVGLYYFTQPQAVSVASNTVTTVSLVQQRLEQFYVYEHRYPTRDELISDQPLVNSNKNPSQQTVYLDNVPELLTVTANQNCTNTAPNLHDHYYLNYQWYDPNAKATTTFPYAIEFCAPAVVKGIVKAGYYLATPHQTIFIGEGGPCQPVCNDNDKCFDAARQTTPDNPPADMCGGKCNNPCHPPIYCDCHWPDWGLDLSNGHGTSTARYDLIWDRAQARYMPSDTCSSTVAYDPTNLPELNLPADQYNKRIPEGSACAFRCDYGYVLSCDSSACRCIVAPPRQVACTTTGTYFSNGATRTLLLGGITLSPTAQYQWDASSSYEQVWHDGGYWPPTSTSPIPTSETGHGRSCDGLTTYPDLPCCGFKCGAAYDWTYASENNTTTYDCRQSITRNCLGALPQYSAANSATNITQNWSQSASKWLPDNTYSHNQTLSTADCYFKCNQNYYYDGANCINHRQAACDNPPQTDWRDATIWNSTGTITQTYTSANNDSLDSAWGPATSTGYNTTPSTSTCYYKCNETAGYGWDDNGNQCSKNRTTACSTKTEAHTVWWQNSCGRNVGCSIAQNYSQADQAWENTSTAMFANSKNQFDAQKTDETCEYGCDTANHYCRNVNNTSCVTRINPSWSNVTIANNNNAWHGWSDGCSAQQDCSYVRRLIAYRQFNPGACLGDNESWDFTSTAGLQSFSLPSSDANTAAGACQGAWSCAKGQNNECPTGDNNCQKCICAETAVCKIQGAWHSYWDSTGTPTVVTACDSESSYPCQAGYQQINTKYCTGFNNLTCWDQNWKNNYYNQTFIDQLCPNTAACPAGSAKSIDSAGAVSCHQVYNYHQTCDLDLTWIGAKVPGKWYMPAVDNTYGTMRYNQTPSDEVLDRAVPWQATDGCYDNGDCGITSKNYEYQFCASGQSRTICGNGRNLCDLSHCQSLGGNSVVGSGVNADCLGATVLANTNKPDWYYNCRYNVGGLSEDSADCGDTRCKIKMYPDNDDDANGDHYSVGYGLCSRSTIPFPYTVDNGDYCDSAGWLRDVSDNDKFADFANLYDSQNIPWARALRTGSNAWEPESSISEVDKRWSKKLTEDWDIAGTCGDSSGSIYHTICQNQKADAACSECQVRTLQKSCYRCGQVDAYTSSSCSGSGVMVEVKHVSCLGSMSDCNNCASIVDPRDNQKYYIEKICGSGETDCQCWFKQNLNYGGMVTTCTGVCNNSDQTKACTLRGSSCIADNITGTPGSPVYKMCLNDNKSAECDSYGGLYWYWSRNDSLCPSGWHIPSADELHTLENNVKSGTTCDGSRTNAWDCSGAGTWLKSNSNGFHLQPAGGFRNANGSFSVSSANTAYLWSSVVYDTGDAYYYGLNGGHNDVYRNYGDKNSGFYVRCIHDQF